MTQLSTVAPYVGAESRRGAAAHIVRALAIGAIAGAIAGFIACGVGSRLAMRVVALTSSQQQQGAITDAEAAVGEITRAGTAFLLLAGTFIGIAGGVLFAATRNAVARAHRWQGLVWGLLLAVTFGSTLVKDANPDFARFGAPALNITMFAALFVLFGLIVAPAYALIDRWWPAPSLRPIGVAAAAAEAVALALAVPATGALIGLVLVQDGVVPLAQIVAALVLLYVLIVVPASVSVLRREVSLGWMRYTALALPLVVGAALDVQAVLSIL